MRLILISAVLLLALPALGHSEGQVVAGASEDKLFQQIRAEKNSDTKLQMALEFEKAFPQSKIIVNVYLLAIDAYREKNDRVGIIRYGEKALTLDEQNVTVMLVLSRNYAIEGKNLDQAAALAQRAIESLKKLKKDPAPGTQSAAEWSAYLARTETAARNIWPTR